MLKDFKAFIMRGNVVDMAVGIIIGAAFGSIVTSFVKDIIMPPIGMLLGKVDFSTLHVTLKEATATSTAVTINYGTFLNTVISFLIIALVVFFFIVRPIARMQTPKKAVAAPPAAPTTKECPHCFSTINIKATRCPNCTSELK